MQKGSDENQTIKPSGLQTAQRRWYLHSAFTVKRLPFKISCLESIFTMLHHRETASFQQQSYVDTFLLLHF